MHMGTHVYSKISAENNCDLVSCVLLEVRKMSHTFLQQVVNLKPRVYIIESQKARNISIEIRNKRINSMHTRCVTSQWISQRLFIAMIGSLTSKMVKRVIFSAFQKGPGKSQTHSAVLRVVRMNNICYIRGC